MSIQISDLDAILKKVIAPSIQNVLYKDKILMSQLKKNSGLVRTGNNSWYITMRTGEHSGIYQVAEGAQIRKGQTSYSQPLVQAKYAFGSFEFTDQAIEAANDSKGAIASILTENSRDVKDDLQRDLNRTWFGYGNGQLTLANGAGVTTTALVVDSTRYIRAGGYIEIGSSGVVQVTSVDSATAVTLASAVSWSDNDVVTRAGDAEMMGLQGLVDDGSKVATIQNITRASNAWANAYVDDTTEALTEADMIEALLQANEFGKVKFVVTDKTLFKKYGEILTSMKRTANLTETLSGGWKGLEFMGGSCGVYLDYDCPTGNMFFIDPMALTIAELTPVSWLDRGGSILTKIPDYAKWEGTLRYYGNLASKNLRACSRLENKS